VEIRKAYTIGLTKRSARDFFETLKDGGIKQLIDIRLNNSSQLAGFTKSNDLQYFLKTICQATYKHELLLAPSKQVLDAYKKQGASWADYEKSFLSLLEQRHAETLLPGETFDLPTVLLFSERTPECCHRRLVVEYLFRNWQDLEIVHL